MKHNEHLFWFHHSLTDKDGRHAQSEQFHSPLRDYKSLITDYCIHKLSVAFIYTTDKWATISRNPLLLWRLWLKPLSRAYQRNATHTVLSECVFSIFKCFYFDRFFHYFFSFVLCSSTADLQPSERLAVALWWYSFRRNGKWSNVWPGISVRRTVFELQRWQQANHSVQWKCRWSFDAFSSFLTFKIHRFCAQIHKWSQMIDFEMSFKYSFFFRTSQIYFRSKSAQTN